MSLSVIMISAKFHPYVGGSERQALEVSKALRRKGVRVLVLTRRVGRLPAREEVEGVPVRRLAAWGGGAVGSCVFMVSVFLYLMLHAREYRVIHVHLASSPAVAGALAGRLLGRRVLVKVAGAGGAGEIAGSRRRFWGRQKLRALGLLRPTLVTVQAAQGRDLAGVGLARLPVLQISNGVDVSVYRPGSPEERGRERAGLGWTGLVFLFVGRLSPDKLGAGLQALETFLNGWSEAFRRDRETTFCLAGSGPQEGQVRALIQEKEIGSSVRMLGSCSEVWRLYRAADVFVLPSVTEGLSNALLEAMASGLPVLGSRIESLRDLLTEGVQGFLFDPLRPEEVRGHLKAIAGQPQRLPEMGRAARELVAERFSLEKTVGELVLAYQGEQRGA